jgi:UDP-N-acetylmuramate dehydrogenase
MNKNERVDITSLSTFALASTAKKVLTVVDNASLQAVVQQLLQKDEPFTIFGGGSNSLFEPFVDKTILRVNMSGMSYDKVGDTIRVTAGAGIIWDDLVLDTIEKGYGGLEALSAIPGNVGAAPIQNVGGKRTHLSGNIYKIEAYDIQANAFISLFPQQCGFAYRASNFKTIWQGKYIVTAVTFNLFEGLSRHISYPGVAAALPTDQPITPLMVRIAITAIRWSKLPKPEILPNVGSFFHNPIITTTLTQSLLEKFPAAPVFASDQAGMSKISAGWLIEQCGWKGRRHGTVGMYEKNALVMVNYGNASLADVLELQEDIQRSVQEKFGISLVREPSIVE